MSQLQIFKFESTEIRTQLIDDDPWFVAKDVCDILDISNSRDAVGRLDDDEKATVGLTDGSQIRNYSIVNEFGLYNLVLSSRKAEAKVFKRWITHDVIPSIRKTGGYQVSKDPILALRLMLQATEETKEEVEDVKNRVVNLEENTSIDPGKYSYIGRRISQKVRQVGKERKWTMNKEQLALLYKDLNKAVAEVSGVRTRAQLREKHFDNVIDLIDDWEPSTATRMLVLGLEDDDAFPTAEESKR
ncbi:ORF6C domain-containing protein [Carnobacterium viridans]|uniref:BRO family, N-terminal domain n=1 Tax=Carnobacterium viridans TaxID=174587 RepID=A0A1H0YXI4_9LACT|nr:BRO family protein [Carnobacterium viridans]UDE94910.1 ORF6C domain-containing protein [Carnobacterium viridans]SDQ19566.1 BRO family, N-terminal domain [Carnobacterium viridans]